MFNSTSVLDKDAAVMTEVCLHGTTEKLVPPGPLHFLQAVSFMFSDSLVGCPSVEQGNY